MVVRQKTEAVYQNSAERICLRKILSVHNNLSMLCYYFMLCFIIHMLCFIIIAFCKISAYRFYNNSFAIHPRQYIVPATIFFSTCLTIYYFYFLYSHGILYFLTLLFISSLFKAFSISTAAFSSSSPDISTVTSSLHLTPSDINIIIFFASAFLPVLLIIMSDLIFFRFRYEHSQDLILVFVKCLHNHHPPFFIDFSFWVFFFIMIALFYFSLHFSFAALCLLLHFYCSLYFCLLLYFVFCLLFYFYFRYAFCSCFLLL